MNGVSGSMFIRRAALLAVCFVASVAAPMCSAVAGPAGAGTGAAPGDRDQVDRALEWSDEVVRGELDNGLTYIVKPHAAAGESVRMMLLLKAGAFHEDDSQRGAGHFIQRMSLAGSEHFPRGAARAFFDEQGVVFNEWRNTFIAFDHAVYTFELPAPSEAAVDRGLLFLSDVLGRLDLSDREIEQQRGVVLEKLRAMLGPRQRIRDRLLPRLAPGSLLGERFPLGEPENIREITPEAIRRYYQRWYTPRGAVLIVVGDVSTERTPARIREAFGDLEAGPPPKVIDSGVRPTEEVSALVATDPEVAGATIEIGRMSVAPGPMRTEADFRRELAGDLAERALQRRLERMTERGESAFVKSTTFSGEIFRGRWYALLQVTGERGAWRELLDQVGTELLRLTRHGFTARDIGDAGRALLAEARRNARVAPGLEAEEIAWSIARAALFDHVYLSASDRLELMRAAIESTSAEEATDAMRQRLDPTRSVFVLITGEEASAPQEKALRTAAREMLKRDVAPPRDRLRPDTLMAKRPEPGVVEEVSLHPESGVLSAWLDNGVRVHHRRMERLAREAVVRITIAGGEIEETERTRGLSAAVADSLDHPATDRLTSTDIRDLLLGANLDISAEHRDDLIAIEFRGDVEDLEAGLQTAHLMLTSPRVEPAALRRWRTEQLQRIAERKTQPGMVLSEVIPDLMLRPGDTRMRPLQRADVEAVTVQRAQAWLERLIAEAPIEAAIVGDVDESRAMELASRYLGSLPQRRRISDAFPQELRAVMRAEPPFERRLEIDTLTPQAIVVVGCVGADERSEIESQSLDMAARVLESRLRRQLIEERGLVSVVGARHKPGRAYPGTGLLTCWAPVDPSEAERVANAMEEALAYFAATGPSAAEMDGARRQMRARAAQKLSDPAHWASALSEMTYRGRAPGRIAGAVETINEVDASDVRTAVARRYGPGTSVRIVIAPASTPAGHSAKSERQSIK